ncbi:hypothetical protein H6G89_08590 [Oscillatoria sp. FACHB-1407]|uniref:hypothetical protein n=1 Tax=Oscillatoria sp. FACHB-1407 TaxID=2692847 RepID=UPI0016841DA7|nr:hypothetical protein [Oscillatoria sp. FACHB-1407]MBD2461098.1 hypothetical protein [Oscillatoria sp. FACHB-1407]
MQTTIPLDNLDTLGVQLQDLLHENLLPDSLIGIRCTLKEEKLIVLGQHQAGISLDPTQTLRFLERTIQSLQLHFTQQVRLYLRVAGQKQPYAHRFFVIQPPPPPPNPVLCEAEGTAKSEEWIVPDEELDALVQELMTHAAQSASEPTQSSPPDGETTPPSLLSFERGGALALISSSALERLATDTRSTWNGWMNQLQGKHKLVIGTGVATLSLAGGMYALTRPCVVGSCSELQTAQDLSQQSIDRVEAAKTKADLEQAQQQLGQAIALLETIPVWSGQSSDARTLMQTYQAQAAALNHLVAAQDKATSALQASENPPHAVEIWRNVRSQWQEAIAQLEQIDAESTLYTLAQQRLKTYRTNLTEAGRHLQREEQAQSTLDVAQQAVQLAGERHRKAHTLADWQLTRATWQIVIMRLQEVTADTTGALEAERLLNAYRPKLAEANERVEQEEIGVQLFTQATQHAQTAQSAERRFAWQEAIARWRLAIEVIQEVPDGTAHATQAQEQIDTYKASLSQAEQKVQASAQVSNELTKVCSRELQACQLMSVSDEIRVQLNPTYVQAIETARNSGNRDLQAIVTDHQLTLRRSLEGIANHFRLPVEVYDPNNGLLDRHLPE